MAESKKAKEAVPVAGSAAAAARTPKVMVTNTYRNRPVQFHFQGGSMRLGPREAQQIDRGALSSPELAHLVRTGVVMVSEPESAGAAAGGGGGATEDRGAGGTDDRAGSRTAKREEK